MTFCLSIGSLRYWYERNKVDLSLSKTAVWDDKAVQGALDCAGFWVQGLPFVKSLSGFWKFFLAPNPTSVPVKFYDSAFEDSEWDKLPGKHFMPSTFFVFPFQFSISIKSDMLVHGIIVIACSKIFSCLIIIIASKISHMFISSHNWSSSFQLADAWI